MPQDSLSYDVRHSKPIQTAPEAAPYSMPAVPSGMLIAIRYFMVQLLPPPAPITPPIPPNPKQNDPTVVGQFEIRVYFMSLGTDRSLLADVRGWCAVHAAHLPVPTFSRDACYRALLWLRLRQQRYHFFNAPKPRWHCTQRYDVVKSDYSADLLGGLTCPRFAESLSVTELVYSALLACGSTA